MEGSHPGLHVDEGSRKARRHQALAIAHQLVAIGIQVLAPAQDMEGASDLEVRGSVERALDRGRRRDRDGLADDRPDAELVLEEFRPVGVYHLLLESVSEVLQALDVVRNHSLRSPVALVLPVIVTWAVARPTAAAPWIPVPVLAVLVVVVVVAVAIATVATRATMSTTLRRRAVAVIAPIVITLVASPTLVEAAPFRHFDQME